MDTDILVEDGSMSNWADEKLDAESYEYNNRDNSSDEEFLKIPTFPGFLFENEESSFGNTAKFQSKVKTPRKGSMKFDELMNERSNKIVKKSKKSPRSGHQSKNNTKNLLTGPTKPIPSSNVGSSMIFKNQDQGKKLKTFGKGMHNTDAVLSEESTCTNLNTKRLDTLSLAICETRQGFPPDERVESESEVEEADYSNADYTMVPNKKIKYTIEEDADIIRGLIRCMGMFSLGGNDAYDYLATRPLLLNRTSQSLRERFRNYLHPTIHSGNVPIKWNISKTELKKLPPCKYFRKGPLKAAPDGQKNKVSYSASPLNNTELLKLDLDIIRNIISSKKGLQGQVGEEFWGHQCRRAKFKNYSPKMLTERLDKFIIPKIHFYTKHISAKDLEIFSNLFKCEKNDAKSMDYKLRSRPLHRLTCFKDKNQDVIDLASDDDDFIPQPKLMLKDAVEIKVEPNLAYYGIDVKSTRSTPANEFADITEKNADLGKVKVESNLADFRVPTNLTASVADPQSRCSDSPRNTCKRFDLPSSDGDEMVDDAVVFMDFLYEQANCGDKISANLCSNVITQLRALDTLLSLLVAPR